MRLAVSILALLAFTLVSPAVAKSDKPPPGQSDAQQNGASKADSDKSRDDMPGKGDKGTSDPSPPGRTRDAPPGKSGKTPAENPASALKSTPIDQYEALQAVEAHEALPLARIAAIAEASGDVQMINAKLVRVQGVLLYQLTMIDDTGHSWRDFYYARSGNPVVLN